MTFLVTLFSISLVGVLFVLLMKLIEFRFGRNVFLPEQLIQKDTEIQDCARARVTAIRQRCVQTGSVVGETCLYWVRHSAKRVARWLAERPRRALQKSQNPSSFLKEMHNHKQEIRRENGYHE